MNPAAPTVLITLLLCGCGSPPVRTTEVHRPDTQTLAHREFVARRTEELQRMGGPLADRAIAESKALEEARSRYGDVPPDVSTTWSWGKAAEKRAAQAEVNDTLEKMGRDRASR